MYTPAPNPDLEMGGGGGGGVGGVGGLVSKKIFFGPPGLSLV